MQQFLIAELSPITSGWSQEQLKTFILLEVLLYMQGMKTNNNLNDKNNQTKESSLNLEAYRFKTEQLENIRKHKIYQTYYELQMD
jgi:hypothetical protein